MRGSAPNTAVLAFVVLVAGSSAAGAQYAGNGNREGMQRQTPPLDMSMMGPVPVAPTVAALVLEHADDIALADSQRVIIESVRRAQDSANRPWMLKLDSLRPTRMPANGMNDLSQEQRDEIEARRIAVAAVMDGMRETNANARQKVMAALNPDQQRKAAEFEERANKKTDEEVKKRSRGRGGMGRRLREG
jgi:hypothetical protein